jgi:hypothetical protein
MQGPSMRPCKFENEAIFSKDLRPKCRLRCTSGAYGMPREKHDAGADLRSRTHSRSLRYVALCCALTQNNGEQGNGYQSGLRAVSGAETMKEHLKVAIRRRHLFGLAIVGVAAAAASTMMSDQAFVKPDNARDKRRARYQANSPEVRNFYRVNSYPRP